MNLCFSTLGCPDWSAEQILACCQENSFPTVELRSLNRQFDLTKASELIPDRREHFRAAFEAIGTSVVCWGTSCLLSPPTDQHRTFV